MDQPVDQPGNQIDFKVIVSRGFIKGIDIGIHKTINQGIDQRIISSLSGFPGDRPGNR